VNRHLERDVTGRDRRRQPREIRCVEIAVRTLAFEPNAGQRAAGYSIEIEAHLAQGGDLGEGRAAAGRETE